MAQGRLKINYIAEINAFHAWLEDHALSSNSILLWFSLLHYCNMTGWRESFNLSMSEIEQDTHMKRRSIERARAELEEAGLIKVSRRGRQSPVYAIHFFGVCDASNENPIGVGDASIGVCDASNENPIGVGDASIGVGDASIGVGDASIGVCDASNENPIGVGDASIGVGDASIGVGDASIGVCDHIPKETYKRINAKESSDQKIIVEHFQKTIHPLQSGSESEMLLSLLEEYGKDLCIKAIDRAVLRGKRTIKYVAGILKRWSQDGYDEPDGSMPRDIPDEVKAIPF